MYLHCYCAACKIPLACNPERVPSIIIAGQREPLCPSCVAVWNARHPDQPDVIPHADAYEPQEVEG
jgi:hypothetical protein